MKFTILKGEQLSADHLQVWRLLQESNSDLLSPFFCPEFILTVAATRDDVRIAVIEDKGSIAGFFPFQFDSNSIGKPVGGIISDYHGIICAPNFQCDAADLLRACGLIVWDFDHLVVAQRSFANFHRHVQPSALIDLTLGFTAYLRQRRAAGSEQFKKITNMMRRLEREVGEIRFIPCASAGDDAIFRQVLSWKSAQYARSMVGDVLAEPWVSNTLNVIRKIDGPPFAGMLSVLYAGEAAIAGHFGMRSAQVWHYWFPAYAPEYSRYSPGLVLLMKMAEAAESLGITTIDLGKGQTLYKDRFKNGEGFVAEGSVERLSFLRLRRQMRRTAKSILLQTPIGAQLKRWRVSSRP